ncbi:polysaccharide biosynthesis protein [Clostridium ragsdalei P11]|uniref:Polysaccharide biosynthesis protein n=1 Tax=Clostridium ragsdalei P11 TaxID=1353534 RepID=A0A1A6AIL7_9CLOT|nr:flippase [Clostridium ragsdalei]OBR89896.1 polysaccharide biosynthesis protein [Clostridium ragsdalei P11]
MASSRSKFLSNVGWLIGGKIANMILQFLVSLATARYLGPSNFGTINYVAAYVSFFSSIASLGLSVIVIKEISYGHSDDNEIIWTSICLRFITAVLSSISVVALMFIVSHGDRTIIVIAILESLSIVFSAFDTINYWFQAKLLSKYSSIAGLLAYIGMSLYRIYLLVTKADIVWFAFATSTDMIFLTLFLMLFYVRKNGFKLCFNFKLGKSLINQSYHYLIAGLITILYSQVDKVMLGNMLDSKSVGLYSVGLTVSTLWGMLPSALIQSLVPILYETAAKDRNLFLRRLRQSYSVIFWLNATYSIFVTVFAKWIVLLLYGQDYLGATKALVIVVWYYGISTMSTLNQVYLANDDKNKYVNRFCLAGLIVVVVLNAMMIPNWGIVGSAVATLITHITIQIIMPLIYKDTREIGVCIIEGVIFKNVINKSEIETIKSGVQKYLKRGEKDFDKRNGTY